MSRSLQERYEAVVKQKIALQKENEQLRQQLEEAGIIHKAIISDITKAS